MLNRMETENWGGVMANLATQIKKMLSAQGVDGTQCPFPAQTLRIENYSLHLPEVSDALSSFAAVISFLFCPLGANHSCSRHNNNNNNNMSSAAILFFRVNIFDSSSCKRSSFKIRGTSVRFRSHLLYHYRRYIIKAPRVLMGAVV